MTKKTFGVFAVLLLLLAGVSVVRSQNSGASLVQQSATMLNASTKVTSQNGAVNQSLTATLTPSGSNYVYISWIDLMALPERHLNSGDECCVHVDEHYRQPSMAVLASGNGEPVHTYARYYFCDAAEVSYARCCRDNRSADCGYQHRVFSKRGVVRSAVIGIDLRIGEHNEESIGFIFDADIVGDDDVDAAAASASASAKQWRYPSAAVGNDVARGDQGY
jgi:hypothetical protein